MYIHMYYTMIIMRIKIDKDLCKCISRKGVNRAGLGSERNFGDHAGKRSYTTTNQYSFTTLKVRSCSHMCIESAIKLPKQTPYLYNPTLYYTCNYTLLYILRVSAG